MLEKNGLIILTSPRPATYQAIEPKVALEIIIKRYMHAKKEALIHLQDFKIKKFPLNLIIHYFLFSVVKVLNLRLKTC